MKENWLTVPVVSERLRVNPVTVRQWLRQEQLRGVLPEGTKLGWRRAVSDLERCMGEHERKPSGQGREGGVEPS